MADSQVLAITVAPHQIVLSTSEAASLLGVSRPTLVRLLESGEIPFDKPGRHRRVRLADLLAYQQRASRGRVQIDVAGRASVEAVLGQMQLCRAAPQPHIQRPVWPEGVLRFDFEPELCVPVNACSRVSYVQGRGDTLHRSS